MPVTTLGHVSCCCVSISFSVLAFFEFWCVARLAWPAARSPDESFLHTRVWRLGFICYWCVVLGPGRSRVPPSSHNRTVAAGVHWADVRSLSRYLPTNVRYCCRGDSIWRNVVVVMMLTDIVVVIAVMKNTWSCCRGWCGCVGC